MGICITHFFFCKSKTSPKSSLFRKKDACVILLNCKTLGNGLGTPTCAKVFLSCTCFIGPRTLQASRNLTYLQGGEPGPTQGGQARGGGTITEKRRLFSPLVPSQGCIFTLRQDALIAFHLLPNQCCKSVTFRECIQLV